MTGPTWRSVFAVGGGAALVASGFLPWRRRGSGSSLSGIELAATLRRSPLAPPWIDLVVLGLLAVPAIGALMVASAALDHLAVATVTSTVGAVVLMAMLVVATAGVLPLADWSQGAFLATAGGAVGAGSVIPMALSRSRA